MAIPVQSQSRDGEEDNPLTPEIIDKINGTNQNGLNRSQKRLLDRLVAGLRSKHQSGVIVTVVESDGRVEMYSVGKFVLGPGSDTTEK